MSTWQQWGVDEPVLAGLRFFELRRLLLDRATPPERKDDLLAALIRVAQAEPDADEPMMVIIVCLLPGLRQIARRYDDIIDAWAELLVAVIYVVRRYDLDRRPHRLAANILWDSTAYVLRAVKRERSWLDATISREPVEPSPPPEPLDVFTEAVRAGVLTYQDAVIIRSTRVDGLALQDVATLLGLSYEAAKKRRRRAEVAWAVWWAPEHRPLTRESPGADA
jgi:DNA-directed RNA polymerase specialized sigma24 family protein